MEVKQPERMQNFLLLMFPFNLVAVLRSVKCVCGVNRKRDWNKKKERKKRVQTRMKKDKFKKEFLKHLCREILGAIFIRNNKGQFPLRSRVRGKRSFIASKQRSAWSEFFIILQVHRLNDHFFGRNLIPEIFPRYSRVPKFYFRPFANKSAYGKGQIARNSSPTYIRFALSCASNQTCDFRHIRKVSDRIRLTAKRRVASAANLFDYDNIHFGKTILIRVKDGKSLTIRCFFFLL